ncbi:hypothetical protein BDZ89DRAFT_971089, partial [Hymenopellis radicata]
IGLGKTLQTLSLFAYVQEHSTTPLDAPGLDIYPLSVLSSWESEAAHWFPSFRALRFHGAAAHRPSNPQVMTWLACHPPSPTNLCRDFQ